jgi:hypothetical protein
VARVTWQPAIGDTVRVVASGQLGTIVHITLTEWGFLYDVEDDGPRAATGEATRRTYAAGEITPTHCDGD